jgi:outer membrane protein
VVQTVRSSFNNISASISSIKAYEQVVVSNQSSLDAMEAGYQVGTRTILDVLTATTDLYQSKQRLADARYDYLINQLNIQSALGTLNMSDLTSLNQVLGKPVTTSATSLAPNSANQNTYADGDNTQAVRPGTTTLGSQITAPAARNPFSS